MPVDANSDWAAVRAWRKERRAELIARREAVPVAERRQWNAAITATLETAFPLLAGAVIGFCWPYRGEFDARFVLRRFRERGAQTALPVVIGKGPLQFRRWWPGAPLKPGVYGIPVPDATEVLVPDAAIVPMNGFDGHGYRLGYGGGYFDRTLAASDPRPLTIGVAYELARLPTIYPRPHDIAMDFVVTEAGIYVDSAAGLARISAEACHARAEQLWTDRRLPTQRMTVRGEFGSPPCYAHEFPGCSGANGKTPDGT